ncbi:Uncharacterised protein [Kluyvera cryocrescens]|uniref:Uncharacterized protein n=1 Tax=Kluyvera cryocrescens TaxID=580 RepID=A0A485A7H2_KLUCR|nr:Uncharacterised protein [Kluyvera cryocrescens]
MTKQTQTYVFYKKFNNPDWVAISYVKKSDLENEMSDFIQSFITAFSICLSIYLIIAVTFPDVSATDAFGVFNGSQRH